MGSHLPTAGSRGGGQLGMIVFLIAVIVVAGVVIAPGNPDQPHTRRAADCECRCRPAQTSSTQCYSEWRAGHAGRRAS